MTKKIIFLLVDDDADDQAIFQEALNEIDESIECFRAANGEEELLFLQDHLEQLPDYIFLDLNMSRMNGKKCLKILKDTELIKEIPVIIYTTSSQVKDKNDTNDLGASYFLTRPFSITDLRHSIESIMAHEYN